jgi:integrase
MPKALTDALVRAATPPAKGQTTITDATLRNFALRISQGGSKTFIVLLGRGKRYTIGHYPTISLSEARTAAKRILAEKELGKLAPARVSFDQARDEYLKDCGSRLRPRTLKNYKDYLAFLPRERLADITSRDIIIALRPLTRSQREHAHRIAKTFYTWCVRHSLLDRSPMETMAPVPLGKPRARVLTEDELRAVWKVARACTTSFHALAALLVLTGQRRGEIAALEWEWIKDDRIEFPASAAKNHRAWTIPITNTAIAVLSNIPRFESSKFVFPATRQRSAHTTVINGWSKAKASFDRHCGITDWTLHDLRRTFATNLQRLGVRLEVTEALLNHVSGSRAGIVGVYQRYQWLPEMREAILTYDRWLTTSP